MDPHPTPFPGKTRRSVATSGKAKPEQGKSGAREPNIIAARYNQVPQRRVFGTIRSTNAKVEDTTNPIQKPPPQTASKSVTRTRKTAFVVHTASLKKHYTDNSPKDTKPQAGSTEAKKKAVSVTFREPLPGKGDGFSPKEQHGNVKKHATVSFREPLTGNCIRGDSPTETKKQAATGSSERKRNSLTKGTGSSESKRNSLTKDAGSSGKKRAGGVAKQVNSFPDVKVPVVVAARVRQQPLGAGKRRSVGSATKPGAEEEPQTPAPLVAAVKSAAALQGSATPYLSARDCSKCRLDRFETASYWITQIKLAESSGKHFVAAEFFRLAYQCNAKPFRRLKCELSSYIERHLAVSKPWPDVCRLYGLLEDEPAATLEPSSAAEELTNGEVQEDVAAMLALEGEVMEKSETSAAIVSMEKEESSASEDCCLVTAVETVSAHSLVQVAADQSHAIAQGRDCLTGSSLLGSPVIIDNYCDDTSSSSDYQIEESSDKATDAQCSSTEDPVDGTTECHGISDENITTPQLAGTEAVAVGTGDACL